MEDMGMDMVIVMDTTAMDIMDTMERERLKLLLSQDTILMEGMDMDMVIVMDTTAMDIMDTMAKERQNLDITIMVIVTVMDMAMVMVMVMDTMDNFKHQKKLFCADSSVWMNSNHWIIILKLIIKDDLK